MQNDVTQEIKPSKMMGPIRNEQKAAQDQKMHYVIPIFRKLVSWNDKNDVGKNEKLFLENAMRNAKSEFISFPLMNKSELLLKLGTSTPIIVLFFSIEDGTTILHFYRCLHDLSRGLLVSLSSVFVIVLYQIIDAPAYMPPLQIEHVMIENMSAAVREANKRKRARFCNIL